MHARGKRHLRHALLATACAGALALTACDGGGTGDGSAGTKDNNDGGGFLGIGGDKEPDPVAATVAQPDDDALILGSKDAAKLSDGMASALFAAAPVVVLAHESQTVRGASAAVALGVPVLVDGPGTAEQLQRLGAQTALAIGPVADPGIDIVAPTSDEALAKVLGIEAGAVTVDAKEAAARVATLDPANPELLADGASPLGAPAAADNDGDDSAATSGPLTSDLDTLPPTTAPTPLPAVTVMSTGRPADVAALATARAAGARVLVGPHTDPRATSDTVEAMAQTEATTVIGVGKDFGPAEDLAWKVRTAATGVELPGGGQLVLPGKTYVALYGTPGTGALGVLGEQSVEETITRAEEHAGWYEPYTDEPVVPTLEIIATVASAGPGGDGNYSEELPISQLEPLVDLAHEHGQYVVLDLQPGQTDFLTQAKLYEDLLKRPNVGLALDPEWRLKPGQKHLVQIGSVEIGEVNEVVHWLADLTRDNDLPQKVLVLHQFQGRMIPEADAVDQSRDEIAVLIHADGQGAQPDKQATWRALHQHAPSIGYWGWKNFYDEDIPMLSAEETMTTVDPVPDFISYQ